DARPAAERPTAVARLQYRQRQPRGAPRVSQHQGPGRAPHLAPAARARRRRDTGERQADRHPAAVRPAPGRRLYLIATGTGAAPFMSLIKDPEVYERFAEIVLVHGVRWARESAVLRHQVDALRGHELLGERVRTQLRYYVAVTREPHVNRGRLTALIESG